MNERTFRDWMINDWPHFVEKLGRVDERTKAHGKLIWGLVIPLLLAILGASVYFGVF